jgi:hypothetical protein
MKRAVIAAVALMILAAGTVLAEAPGDPDVYYDIASSRLGETCFTLDVDGQGWWYGREPYIVVKSGQTLNQYHCYTDCIPEEDPVACMMAGDFYGRFRATTDKDTYGVQIDGMRRAAGVVIVTTPSDPPQVRRAESYLGAGNDTIEPIGPIYAADKIEIHAMWCPDINGDTVVDLFYDIWGTIDDYGKSKPWSAPWYGATDHDESGSVDLFNDFMIVTNRYGLVCNNFFGQ